MLRTPLSFARFGEKDSNLHCDCFKGSCHTVRRSPIRKRKVQESNLLHLAVRPLSRRFTRPYGLPPHASCGGRSRTCNRLVNSEPPYRSATPQCESGWEDLNLRSRHSQRRDHSRLVHILFSSLACAAGYQSLRWRGGLVRSHPTRNRTWTSTFAESRAVQHTLGCSSQPSRI